MTPRADHRRAKLSRYVPWMARDYLTNQGPSTALVVLLIGFLSFQGAADSGLQFRSLPDDTLTRILRQLAGYLVYLGSFFATNGIVANDRKAGYYRFLFSKPVHPPAYYALTFLVYGAGLVLVTVVLLATWSALVRPAFPLELLGVVALMYIAYGGIGFLLSAAWRFDWLSLVTVLIVANVGWQLWGDSEGVIRWLLHLLPPVHHADAVYAMILREPHVTVAWPSIVWLGAYGFACFLLGMLVIRKRPLGTS